MASSGTYNFALSNGGVTLAAFERIKIRAPSLRAEHMNSAQVEMNLALQGKFSNLQPNLWKVELDPITLQQSVPTYPVSPQTVMILDAYRSLNYGTPQQTDIYMTPLSRTSYASIAAKQDQGPPNSYWFDRLISPTVTLWPVPDASGPYVMNLYACVRVQDAALPGGETPDMPVLWIDALVAELAHRMARIYATELEQARKLDAKEAWDIAAAQNTENVNLSIALNLGSYYR
jgi:hypothetical protein